MAKIFPIAETTPRNNSGGNSRPDADDPAIYYNSDNPAASMVIGTQKNAGLAVYNLDGLELQTVNPGNVRYNNVDIVYDFDLGSESIDLAIASERNNDSLSIFRIDADSKSLTEVTSNELTNTNFSIFGVDNSDSGAYGLAAYTSSKDGKSYVFVTQNNGNAIAQLELTEDDSGKITADVVRKLNVPKSGGKAEGLVVDRDSGTLYVGQENFGIYKFNAEADGGNSYEVVDRVYGGSGELQSDVEGLAIDYSNNYLIASSQGSDSFVIYNRFGNNQPIDTFSIDGVQATDGIDILNRNLGGEFAGGLMVVQDGQNENGTTNFKYLKVTDLPIKHIDTANLKPNNFDSSLDVDDSDDLLKVESLPRFESADTFTGLVSTGSLSGDVTASVQVRQVEAESNYGWEILTTGSDGINFDLEGFSLPNLIEEYTLNEDNDNLITTSNYDLY